MTTHETLKAGEQLAHRVSDGTWMLDTITRITPTGRIIIGATTLNPDLTVRNGYKRYTYCRATPEIIEEIHNQDIVRGLRKTCKELADECIRCLSSLTLEQLRILAAGLTALKEKIEK